VFSPKFHNVVADTYVKEERFKMQSKRVAFVTVALLLAPLISITPASADKKPPAPLNQNGVDLNSAYKVALDKFRADSKAYEDKRREINKIFKETIDKAMADARSAKSVGQTQIQKRQSMSIKQSAVIAATVARDAAIEALGAPPIAPTPPAKTQRAAKSKTPQPQSS
jgi:hypothetical protein